MVVLRVGTHNDKVTVAILKLILWRTGSQCKSERTGVMWQNRGFCATSRARVLDTLKASQIRNGCASQERIAEIKSGANYCCSYGFGSISSERSPNVTQRTNMEITSLACFRHLFELDTFQISTCLIYV